MRPTIPAALPPLLALLAASCATTPPAPQPSPPCPAGGLSPLLGCFKVLEATKANADGGMRAGSLLQFDVQQATLYNDETTWARMGVRWSPPSAPGRLSGEYTAGGSLELEEIAPGRIAVSDSGKLLGTAQRLSGSEAEADAARLAAVPSLEAMRARTRACLEAYASLMPDDRLPREVHPETFGTTASAHGIIGLARVNLLRKCKPVPEPCALPPMGPSQREAIESLEKGCRERGPSP